MNPSTDLAQTLGPALALDPAQIVQVLLLSFVLGVVVTWIHRVATGDRIVSPALTIAMIVLTMVGAMVMMAIGNSLARAFSLVGALAMVRFRTQLQTPLDSAFVFLALVTGIATGVLGFSVAIVGVGVIGLAVLALGIVPAIRGGTDVRLLRCDLAAHEVQERTIGEIIDRHVRKRWLESAESLRFGETLSMTWRVTMRSGSTLEGLVSELSKVEGVERVVILASEADAGTVG